MENLYVSIALLKNKEGLYLLTARPKDKPLPGIYELPGGKLDEGETPEHAMIRELKEELGIIVAHENLCPITFLSHPYEDKYHVVMFVYEIDTWEGEITLLEGQGAMVWAAIDDFHKYPLIEADLVLLEQLRRFV